MYLDPGFGSMVIQLLVAGFAVLGTAFYFLRGKIRNLFKRDPKDAAAADASQNGGKTE